MFICTKWCLRLYKPKGCSDRPQGFLAGVADFFVGVVKRACNAKEEKGSTGFLALVIFVVVGVVGVIGCVVEGDLYGDGIVEDFDNGVCG